MSSAPGARVTTPETLGRAAAISLIAALALASCHPRRTEHVVVVSSDASRLVQAQDVGTGVRCLVDGHPGPISYPAAAAGKAGVPNLTRQQDAMLHKIVKHLRSSTVRFSWVGGEFIIFDASDGPCEPYAPGYPVLNMGCAARYSPTDDFDRLSAVDSCFGTPYPWAGNAAFQKRV